MTYPRRSILKSSLLLGAPTLLAAEAKAASEPGPLVQKGFGVAKKENANPLEAKIRVFTVVAPDLDASIAYYTKVMGFSVVDEGTVAERASTAPGLSRAAPKYVTFRLKDGTQPNSVRVIQAPPNAQAIRPRPQAKTWDPGILCMEGGTRDPAESYHALKSANTPTISPPRYYPYRGIGFDVDPMSYAAFGPAGEQMFITASINNQRSWKEPGLHSVPGNVAIVSLDQRPVDAFYEKAFGLKRVNQFTSQQRNCNELIGAPEDAIFLWGNIGLGVSIEVWEFKMPEGTMWPCSLDKTGVAMMTVTVNDLEKCRAMCKAGGIKPVGEGALPIPGNKSPKGFTLRGAVGELIEVISA